jgi:hypothetical protein
MTREDLKKQVLLRVKVPAEFSGLADTVMNDWLKGYREGWDFGPSSVLSVEREVRRKLNLAQRAATPHITKRP